MVIVGKTNDLLGQYDLEVATTLAQQTTGLIGRTSLPANQGMMMDLGSSRKVTLWMKNTLISLDMIFTSDDGTISKTAKGLQPNDATPVSSGGPVRAVIELLGGTIDNIGAGVGDRVMVHCFPEQRP